MKWSTLRRGLRLFLILTVTASPMLGAVARPTAARAQPQAGDRRDGEADAKTAAQARKHFAMGVGFFREANFGAALIEFQRAHELIPHHKVLFNLGQTYIELQEYGKAIEHLRGYLEEGGEDVPAARRQQVEEMIREQEARLATVRIQCNEDGARVFLDERFVGTTPLDGPLQAGAGRRQFRITKEGFVTAEQRIDLGAGDDHTLELVLEPVGGAARLAERPVRPASAPEYDEPPERDFTLVWVAGVGTLVLGGATATMAALTAQTEADLEAERGALTRADDLRKLRDKLRRRALLTDVGLGLTVAAAITTTVLYILAQNGGTDPELALPTIAVDQAGASLQVRGAF